MAQVTLLDGSIGQELVKRSGDRATPLWSTQVMLDRPGLVEAVHRDYFDAGATVATTNTYAVLKDRLVRVGIQDRHGELLDIAVSEAEAARSAHGSGRIAVALGPLGASYRPDLRFPPEEAEEIYAEIARALGDRADVFLAETVSSVEAAEGVLRGAAHGGKPVWLAVSVSDDDGTKLRSDEPLDDLGPMIERYDPAAVLINCSPPEVIGAGLEILRGFGRPFGAYANGFTRISDGFLSEFPTVDALEQRVDLTPEAYARIALGWVDQGATIVGGCCEVGPAHIAELARQLRAAGHEIV